VFTLEGAKPRRGHFVATWLLYCAEMTMAVLFGLRIACPRAARSTSCFSTHCQHFGKWKLQLSVVEYVQYAVLLSMGNTQACASKYAQPLITVSHSTTPHTRIMEIN
jgi:uncharacterized protein YqiB (DUF1249 family)